MKIRKAVFAIGASVFLALSASSNASAAGGTGFMGFADSGAAAAGRFFPDPVSACRDIWSRSSAVKGVFYGAYQLPSQPFIWYCSWQDKVYGACTWPSSANDPDPSNKVMEAGFHFSFPDWAPNWLTPIAQTGPQPVYHYCQYDQNAGFQRCYTSAAEVPPPNKSCKSESRSNTFPAKGEPIALLDGAEVESITDFATGDGKLFISREYRNLPAYLVGNGLFPPPVYNLVNNAPPLGSIGGWRLNFQTEIHIRPGSTGVTLHLPTGVAYDWDWSTTTLSYQPRTDLVLNDRYKLELLTTPPADMTKLTTALSQWRLTDREENRVWTFQTFPLLSPFGAFITNPHSIARPIQMTAQGYVWNFTYNANGVLQSIVDSYGRTFSFTWNYFAYGAPLTGCAQRPADATSIATITLPNGGKLRYTYNAIQGPNGPEAMVRQLTAADQLDSAGAVIDHTTYQYEDTRFIDALTGITDSRGVRYATIAYDGYGRATSSVLAGGVQNYSVGYSLTGTTLTRTVTNPLGKVATYNFENPGSNTHIRLSSVNGAASASCPASARAYTYDGNGWVATQTDEEGRVTSFVRDALNRPTSITRGYGTAQAATTTLTWHPTFNIPTQIVEPGRTTNVTVGSTGLVTQVSKVDTGTQTVPYSTNGQTRNWAYGYNATGQLTSVDGPLAGTGDTVKYAYVASGANAGNLQTITNEMGKVTTVTAWNGRGQPTSVTDANGVVTTLAYEPARGLLTQMKVDATGTSPATTTIAYDAIGEVTKVTLPNGAYESYAYDNARRLTTITNAAGETISYVRDNNGDATSVTIKRANATTAYSRTRAFDELGRLLKSIGADGPTKPYQFAYDKTDNLKTVTDPRSGLFQYGFDPLNRLISETDEENKTVALTRDGTDAVTAYKDARALTTTYVRNGFDEVIQEVSPDRGSIVYLRDARGLVTQRTDARGVATYYSYDNAGRLTGKTYSGSSSWQSFNWDASAPDNKGVGRLVGIYSDAGSNWRVFDAKGRVSVDYRTNNPAPALAVTYSYDAAGNIAQIIYPSGRRVNYTRDAMGRVSSVTTQQNAAAAAQTVVWNLAWNPYGPLASMSFGYGGLATYTADADYRITRYQVGSSTSPGSILDRSLTWTGDIVTAIVDNVNPGTVPPSPLYTYTAQSQSFAYTPTRRLSSAAGYYGALSWTYDANGNRASETANGVTSTYAYPAGSNRLSSVTPAGGSARSFAYDASGNILTDSRTGTLAQTFQYDPEGRLSKATSASSSGTYAYDAQDRLASRTALNGGTTTTTLYVHDVNDHIIAETDATGVTRREYLWLNDLPIAVVDGVNTASPTLYYVHADHLGRPARMLAQNWAWVWDVVYMPFGAVSSIWDGTSKLDMRFPGQWFQLESGLAYNWHRHYDATIGRYVQPDPIGYAGGQNVYGYGEGNPNAKIDPFGTQVLTPPFASFARPPITVRPPLPDFPVDPALPPGPGWVWRGRPGCPPGGPEGNWFNPATRESLRPDMDHPPPVDPHYDYRGPDGTWYRWFPNGDVVPKT